MTWRWPKRRFDQHPTWDLCIGIVAPPVFAAAILGALVISPPAPGRELGRWVTVILVALLFGFLCVIFSVAPCLAELHRRGRWTPLRTGRHVRLEAAALTLLFGVLTLGLMFGVTWFVGFLGQAIGHAPPNYSIQPAASGRG